MTVIGGRRPGSRRPQDEQEKPQDTGPQRPWATPKVAVLAVATSLALLALLVPACSGNGRSAKALCDSLRTGQDPVALFAAEGGRADQVAAGITRLHELEGKAPSPVSDALLQLIEVGQDLQQVLTDRAGASAGTTPATMPAADTDKATKASTTVQQFASSRCAITLGATTTTAPPPAS